MNPLTSRFYLRSFTFSIMLFSILTIAFPHLASAARSSANISLQSIEATSSSPVIHVRIAITPHEDSINAAEVVLAYNNDALKLEHIDSTNSDFQFEIPFEVTDSVIHIPRGNFTALEMGEHVFADIYFTRTSSKKTEINILPSSIVTASDGEGTNVFDGQLAKLFL
jgi:hypothetical protein